MIRLDRKQHCLVVIVGTRFKVLHIITDRLLPRSYTNVPPLIMINIQLNLCDQSRL